MKINVESHSGSILRVSGPASVRVLDGRVHILGRVLGAGESVIISMYKSYPLQFIESSRIEVELGSGGYVENPREEDEVLPEWIKTAQEIIDKNSRIIVVGPVESGKSSLTTLLANTAIARGLKTCVIDADIGQQDIGPPGFISMTCPREPFVWLRDLMPEHIRIVGSLTPSQYSSRLVSGVMDLVGEAVLKGAEVVIINTDGWISSPQALEMKLEMARYVRARYILALQKGYYLGGLTSSLEGLRIIPLPSPQGVRVRSREDRRALRSQAYRKFFEGASQRTLEIAQGLIIVGSCLASGEKLSQDKISELGKALGLNILYGSKYENSVYLYVQAQDKSLGERILKYQDLEVQIIPQGSERGLLASLLDPSMREVAPAILESLDLLSGILKIVTRYNGPVAGVVIGRIKIDSLYDDSVRYSRCPI
ncbi:MAG: Clp1/GlmU family protein [Sulfolobales archaeon]